VTPDDAATAHVLRLMVREMLATAREEMAARLQAETRLAEAVEELRLLREERLAEAEPLPDEDEGDP
jgi:hypothetical protein